MMIWRSTSMILALATGILFEGDEVAAFVQVYGGPEYTSSTGTGYYSPHIVLGLPTFVNNSGVAAANTDKYISGAFVASVVARWDDSGASVLDSVSSANFANAINNSGTVVGYAYKFDSGNSLGPRAVRWDGSGTSATELEHLGTSGTGYTESYAIDVNDGDSAVGFADKYISGTYYGERAVRWDSLGTSAIELGHLGTNSLGFTQAGASAVNSSNTIVGVANKYDSGTFVGQRAVRWDSSGTIATELGNLGTSISGYTQTYVLGINESGTAVGFSDKYDSGTLRYFRAVRWDGSATNATELGNLGTDDFGNSDSRAIALNDSGTAVGFAQTFDAGIHVSFHAVRWDGSGTTAEKLGKPRIDGFEYTDTFASDINNNNIAVGIATTLGTDYREDQRAVLWGINGHGIDLNRLIDPLSGWTLYEAHDISDTGWIGGLGAFDPDGPGGEEAYYRVYVMHIPEPSSMLLLGLGGTTLLRLHRRGGKRGVIILI
jgi:hypothetical protein